MATKPTHDPAPAEGDTRSTVVSADRDEFGRLVTEAVRDVRHAHGQEAADVFMDVLEAYGVSRTLAEPEALELLRAVQRGEWRPVAARLAELDGRAA